MKTGNPQARHDPDRWDSLYIQISLIPLRQERGCVGMYHPLGGDENPGAANLTSCQQRLSSLPQLRKAATNKLIGEQTFCVSLVLYNPVRTRVEGLEKDW